MLLGKFNSSFFVLKILKWNYKNWKCLAFVSEKRVLFLKIKGIEFVYDGATRLIFDEEGRVKEHRDYFDFCSGTFGNIPIIGAFFKWLYARFVD